MGIKAMVTRDMVTRGRVTKDMPNTSISTWGIGRTLNPGIQEGNGVEERI
jgi:hypothetical protein